MLFRKYPKVILISSKISDGNMSLVNGEPQKALENRERFLKNLGINTNEVAEVTQVHGNRVILIKEIIDPNTEADGMITNRSDTYLMVKTADCISIGIYDPKHNSIGLIHVGWKGLDKGIIKNAIKLMHQKFNTNPKKLVVEFSPSIGPCHYGGPPEIRNTIDPKWQPYIAKGADENHGFDLWKFTEDQLIKLGVLKENITNPKICTFESRDYFSHRRSVLTKEPDYRFATILGMKS